jgi:hypothetical protein
MLLTTAPRSSTSLLSLSAGGNKVSAVLQRAQAKPATVRYRTKISINGTLFSTLGEHTGEDALYLSAIPRGEIPIDGALQTVAK